MTINGDESNENLTIAEDAAHKMVIKNGSTEINHAQCYVDDTLSSINANLFGGNDMATVELSVSASIRIFIRGGSQDDTLTGGNGPDTLEGTGGRDVLIGGGGDDLLMGGSDADLLDGSEGDDTLDGGFADDVLLSGPGDDRMIGGDFNDTDVADYQDELADLHLTIDANADDGAPGEHDYIDPSIEIIWGGNGNDFIVGSESSNTLLGGGGDDTINGGPGTNADFLDGGSGTNWIDYSGRTDPLRIDLTTADPINGDYLAGEGDVLHNFENVLGGHGPDTITGTDGRNIIYAGEGDDFIDGNGDDDQINAQAGDDRIILKTKLPTYPTIDGGADYDILDMVAGSYSFSDDAAAHELEQINLSQSSSLTFGATQHLFDLNVSDISTATLDADGLRLLHLRALSVSSDSILNLTNNGMILDTGDIGAIGDLIKLGLDTGMGLVSFSASNRLLGVRSNSGPLYTNFLGEPNLNGSEILVRYTVVGDLNLDRQVSIADFIDLSSHFGQLPANWGEGDVNYDDSVSIADFIALASNFGQSFSGSVAPQAPLSSPMLFTTIKRPRRRAQAHRRSNPGPESVNIPLPVAFLGRKAMTI